MAPGSPGGMNFANTPLGSIASPPSWDLEWLEMFGKMMVKL